MFSYEFCESSENTFIHRTPPVAAFDSSGLIEMNIVFVNIVNIESDNSQLAKARNMQDWVLREPADLMSVYW